MNLENKNSVNREEKQRSLGIRSQAVNEILGLVPHWMIRWGNSLIFILVLGVLAMSYFIKYPDSIPIEVSLTTSSSPQRIIAKSSGALEQLLISDQEAIAENQLLAVIRDDNGNLHQIQSEVDGTVYFHRFWIVNMAVNPNDTLFSITPNEFENYVGHAKVASQNHGVFLVGQKVNFSVNKSFLDQQRAHEGYVSKVSNVVDAEGYFDVEVVIAKEKLNFSENRNMTFKPGLKLHGQIITQELSLLERIFSQFTEIIKE